ncbi:N-acyl-L-amino acid amidohydrolase [Brevibacillus choshinensis]|uniref:N-acyl-L-amino acid amidohydrolase n=1 Tax=Brevibacillus choshinensis TaxID=54911 RepID=A0ABR5MZ98_BRECH|nr:amidohydrolase [Brevibacillus choshinensis]KQL43443.1 N-acyl-L-amino acid amidohydrolase [Brevibacillus choshinensis]
MISKKRTKLLLSLCATACLLVPNSGAVLANSADSPYTMIDQRAKAIEQKLINWRHDIHQNPELGNREFRTSKLVADHLKSLGLEVRTNVAKTGVVGVLRGKQPGPVVALRADMDALPVVEQTDFPFKSTVKSEYNGMEVGVAHSCGHDTHTAILMAVAEVLTGMKNQLPGTVVFVFQPAEEGAPAGEEGGAKLMMKEGALDNPKPEAIFMLHTSSGMNVGQVSYVSGPSTASANAFKLNVKGSQTHGAMPWLGVDPIVVSSQIITAFQTIESRQVNVIKEPSVLSVGSIHGGNRNNIIPDEVDMEGTLRTYDEGMRQDILKRMERTATMIAESAGAKAKLTVEEGIPTVVNNPDLVAQMAPTLKRVVGEKNANVGKKGTAAEDFSFFSNEIPGMSVSFGVTAANEDPAKAAPNHSPLFKADDASLIVGTRVLANLAIDYLNSHKE